MLFFSNVKAKLLSKERASVLHLNFPAFFEGLTGLPYKISNTLQVLKKAGNSARILAFKIYMILMLPESENKVLL